MKPAHDVTVGATSRTWDAHYASERGYRYWPAEELVRSVSANTSVLGKADVLLEVGCGNGANLWFLAEHTRELFGLDCSQVALDAAAAYTSKRLGLDSLDGRGIHLMNMRIDGGLSLPDGEFDGVVDCLTSQHVPWRDHGRLYADYFRILKPGGWLFLQHLDNGTVCKVSRMLGQIHDYHEVELFPEAGFTCLPSGWDLERVLHEAGFETVNHRRKLQTYRGGLVASYSIIDAYKAKGSAGN